MSEQRPTTQAQETVSVTTDKIVCDGNGGALGHPRIYMTMGRAGRIDCPYCGKRYVKSKAANA